MPITTHEFCNQNALNMILLKLKPVYLNMFISMNGFKKKGSGALEDLLPLSTHAKNHTDSIRHR